MARDFETFRRDMAAGRKQFEPLGRRGWEAKRAEVIREVAQLENYPRRSKAQEEQLEGLSMHQQVLESLITEDDIAQERQRDAIRTGLKAGTVGIEGGAMGMEDLPAGRRSKVEEQEPTWIRQSDGRKANLSRGQKFADHQVVEDYSRQRKTAEETTIASHGSIGNLVKSMSTTSGSAIVPTAWASRIIDRARNASAVLRAGAVVVPMDAKTVQIGRLTGDPTAAFRTEGSTIVASDPVLDNVTLDSKTMSALVIGSLEWFQDAPNADDVVEQAVAAAIATHLDYVSLFGGVTTGGEGINLATPPNPRGILATLLASAASSVLGSGANGTAQTAASYYREVLSTIFTPRSFNEEPTALLWNAKLWQQYADAYATDQQPLQAPAAVADLARFVTNQIPSFTQGTMTSRATDLFVGDFRQLLIGQRLSMTVQTLTERYAELGQIGIVAHWRGDVQLARPRAFSVYRYLQGAL